MTKEEFCEALGELKGKVRQEFYGPYGSLRLQFESDVRRATDQDRVRCYCPLTALARHRTGLDINLANPNKAAKVLEITGKDVGWIVVAADCHARSSGMEEALIELRTSMFDALGIRKGL